MTNPEDRYTASLVGGLPMGNCIAEAHAKLREKVGAANQKSMGVVEEWVDAQGNARAKLNRNKRLTAIVDAVNEVASSTQTPTTPEPKPDVPNHPTGPTTNPLPSTEQFPAIQLESTYNHSSDSLAKTADTKTVRGNTITPPPVTQPSLETEVTPGNTIPSKPVTTIKTDSPVEEIPSLPGPKVYNSDITLLTQDPETLLIVNVLTYHFGDSWVTWEPETVRQEISDRGLLLTADGEDIPEESVFDHIFALQLIFSHTGFMDFWKMFEKVAKALNKQPVIMTTIQTVTPAEAVYFRKMINILRPDVAEEDFGKDIKKYIAASCMQQGMFIVPEKLKSCQNFLDKLSYTNTQEDKSKAVIDLQNFLWDIEPSMYNMTTEEFNTKIGQFDIPETPNGVQIANSLRVITYVRDRLEANKNQVKLG